MRMTLEPVGFHLDLCKSALTHKSPQKLFRYVQKIVYGLGLDQYYLARMQAESRGFWWGPSGLHTACSWIYGHTSTQNP